MILVLVAGVALVVVGRADMADNSVVDMDNLGGDKGNLVEDKDSWVGTKRTVLVALAFVAQAVLASVALVVLAGLALAVLALVAQVVPASVALA